MAGDDDPHHRRQPGHRRGAGAALCARRRAGHRHDARQPSRDRRRGVADAGRHRPRCLRGAEGGPGRRAARLPDLQRGRLPRPGAEHRPADPGGRLGHHLRGQRDGRVPERGGGDPEPARGEGPDRDHLLADGVAGAGGGKSYAYRASKAASLNLGRNLAADFARDGVAVGIYHPGWVRTGMGGRSADITAEASADGLHARIAALDAQTSGCFETWDGRAHPL